MTTSLYRHFADDGSLLYVGISLSWPARTKAHKYGSRWFDLVARVEIERFDTREQALEAEKLAIQNEHPKFNVVHNKPSKVKKPPKRKKPKSNDPLLRQITGPIAIVGPALIYQGEMISLMIAHGHEGTEGALVEVQLGKHFPDLPDWSDMVDTVFTIRGMDDLTMDEAQDKRAEIVRKLKKHLGSVEVYETDLALAVAYASTFPSDQSRQVLDEIAIERGAK